MANDLNLCQFIGRLGADPETRYAPSGDAICNIRLAVSENWTDKASGEKKERTEWVRISFFGKLGEIAGQYLRKGSQAYIAGKMVTRKWQDKDGQDRYSTEIRGETMQMLGGRPEGAEPRPPSQNRPQQNNAAQQSRPASGGMPDFDDDIPFIYHARGIAGYAQ